jgi:hypothetical protein
MLLFVDPISLCGSPREHAGCWRGLVTRATGGGRGLGESRRARSGEVALEPRLTWLPLTILQVCCPTPPPELIWPGACPPRARGPWTHTPFPAACVPARLLCLKGPHSILGAQTGLPKPKVAAGARAGWPGTRARASPGVLEGPGASVIGDPRLLIAPTTKRWGWHLGPCRPTFPMK